VAALREHATALVAYSRWLRDGRGWSRPRVPSLS
jgi:hypothetical protein